jgi:tetratricopeptide (TPR) repeat protein
MSRVLHVDPMEVLGHVERALEPLPSMEGLTRAEQLEKADELFWAGRFREAAATYDLLLAGIPLSEDSFPDGTLRQRVGYEIRRAASLRRSGFLLAARSAAERIVAATTDHRDLQAEGYMVLSASYRQLNNLPLALDSADRATELSSAGDARLRGRVLLQKGACLLHAERFDEARATFLAARKIIRSSGDRRHASHVEGNIGMCWDRLGDQERAFRWVGRAVELARRHAIPALEASWLVELGHLDLRMDREDSAEQHSLAAIRLAKPRELWIVLFRAEWLLFLIDQKRIPSRSGRHRIAYLKTLFRRLEWHEGDASVREFRELILDADRDPKRKPS